MDDHRILIRDALVEVVHGAALKAQESGFLPSGPLPEINLEQPQKSENGDYASSLPMKLARSARKNPIQIAERLVQLFPDVGGVGEVWVAPPGFINFRLSPKWVQGQVETILGARGAYGEVDLGKGQTVQVEFVSGNPTGPLHVGHARGAVLGSTLSNILVASGYKVHREYYLNDTGSQMDVFNRSLFVRYQQVLGREVSMPEDGYQGEYLAELAKELASGVKDKFLSGPEEEAVRELGDLGKDRIIELIKRDLQGLGVEFDSWFSELSLFQSGEYDKVIDLLQAAGHLEERDGAVWFVSRALGEDKDNVVIRSTGASTYFASDTAYHYNKFANRKFDLVVDIWGADHQGHVSRMKAVLVALGINPERLQILISQMVTLRRGVAEVVRISKRTGDIVTLRELLDEVGPDPCRFFFLSHSADSQMDFDLELAKKESQENPVHYVQYGHARIASILRHAAERGIDYQDGDVHLLGDAAELELVRKMLLLPELVEAAARNMEPHYLPHYAIELATAFHWFYQQCRVVSEDVELTKARLKLVHACQLVLAKTLGLIGVTTPEEM